MTHLIEARKALNAELDSLRTRAEQIIALLEGLNALDAAEIQEVTKPAKVKKPAAKKEGKKAAALPDTGGNWFAELMPEKPALRKDIFAAAVKKAGGKLSKETTLQLSRRLDAALTKLAEKGSVKKEQTKAGNLYSKA